MFFSVTHIDLSITGMAYAEAFWGKLIRLKEVKRGEGFVDLDSGKVARPVSHPACPNKVNWIQMRKAASRTGRLRLRAVPFHGTVQKDRDH